MIFFSNVGCTTVTCSFTIDNKVEHATYNGDILTITTDDLTSWQSLKSVEFESCSDTNPGILQVKGTDYASNVGKFLHVFKKMNKKSVLPIISICSSKSENSN